MPLSLGTSATARMAGSGGHSTCSPSPTPPKFQCRKQIARDSHIHGGVATCCPGKVVARRLWDPPVNSKPSVSSRSQGLPFPEVTKGKKGGSWKTFRANAALCFSQPLAALVALLQSTALETYCVPGTVLAWGCSHEGPDPSLSRGQSQSGQGPRQKTAQIMI